MENYRDYLPELKSTTLFRDMSDDEIICVLEAMQPEIIEQKAGEMPSIKRDFQVFRMILQGDPNQEIAPRKHKYDMPKFGEPGMLMAEIPSLSRIFEGKKPGEDPGGRPEDGKCPPKPEEGKGPKKDPKRPPIKPLPCDMKFLELSGEMLTKPYGPEVAEVQGKMIRNLLGILAQKVMDVRKEKFEMMREYEEKLAISDRNQDCFL